MGGDSVKTLFLGKIEKKFFKKISEKFMRVFSPPVKTHFFLSRSKKHFPSFFLSRRQLSQPNYRTRLTPSGATTIPNTSSHSSP